MSTGDGKTEGPRRPAPWPAGGGSAMTFSQFVWLWNLSQGRTTPELHRLITEWLDENWLEGDRRLLLMVFRDAGKSTLIGLFCAWLLLHDPEYRILVLAAEHGLACKMTRNVRQILERHPATRHLVPANPREWAADQFTVNRQHGSRDPSLLARGISANITGARADIVICDDVEVPNTCDTPGKREELRLKLAETSFILVPGGLQLYIGTPHSYYSIYADKPRIEAGEEVPFLDGYNRLVLPILDEHGRSRWPERFPLHEIERLKSAVGPARFRSQMLLMPTNIQEMRLDPDRLIRYDAEISIVERNRRPVLSIDGTEMRASVCWWDPAYGAPGRGDASVIACVFVDATGHYWLHALEYLTFDPARTDEVDEATQLCRQVVAFARENEQAGVTVETNGLGKFMPALLRREASRAGIALAITEAVSTRSKDRRILDAFDPVLAAGHLRIHERVARSGFLQEMQEWLPGRNCRDDALDAVSGCLLSTPVRLGTGPRPRPRPDWRGFNSFRASADFAVLP